MDILIFILFIIIGQTIEEGLNYESQNGKEIAATQSQSTQDEQSDFRDWRTAAHHRQLYDKASNLPQRPLTNRSTIAAIYVQHSSSIRNFKPTISDEWPQCFPYSHTADNDSLSASMLFQLDLLKNVKKVNRAELHILDDYWQQYRSFSYSAKNIKTTPKKYSQRRKLRSGAGYELNFIDCAHSIYPLNRIEPAYSKWRSYNARAAVEETLQSTKSTNDMHLQVSQNGRILSRGQLTRLLHYGAPFLVVVYTDNNSTTAIAEHNSSPISAPIEIEGAEMVNHHNIPRVHAIRGHSRRNVVATDTENNNERDDSKSNYYAYQMVHNDNAMKETKIPASAQRKYWKYMQKIGRNALRARKNKKNRIYVSNKSRYDSSGGDDPMMGFGQESENTNANDDEQANAKLPSYFNDLPKIDSIVALSRDAGVDVHLLDRRLRVVAEEASKNKSGDCSRKSLIVDFRDIGWDKWIIAPKTFDMGYCSGACNHIESVVSSNHAILQSTLKLSGAYPSIPEACCVPEKYDSLTLVYFNSTVAIDSDEEVLLTNFPRMSVISCVCL